MPRQLPPSFATACKPPQEYIGCYCGTETIPRLRCENQLIPWMLQYNRQKPVHLRLPYELWQMVLTAMRDQKKLKQRADLVVSSCRQSIGSCRWLQNIIISTIVMRSYWARAAFSRSKEFSTPFGAGAAEPTIFQPFASKSASLIHIHHRRWAY